MIPRLPAPTLPALTLGALTLLAGCAAPQAGRRVTPPPMTVAYTTAGLERVIGQDADGLVRLFGKPDADVREGAARKLQFGSAICVLDTYLYPTDGAPPRVTYIDAREPDGSAIDRASCVAALTRRDGGK